MIVTGTHDGRPLMTFTATWYCTEDLEPAWTVPGWDGWHVQVDGDAPLDVDIRFAIPDGADGRDDPGYTANRAVNAVPYVCAAAPGIRTTVDLRSIRPWAAALRRLEETRAIASSRKISSSPTSM